MLEQQVEGRRCQHTDPQSRWCCGCGAGLSKGAVEEVDVVQDEEMLKSISHPLGDVLAGHRSSSASCFSLMQNNGPAHLVLLFRSLTLLSHSRPTGVHIVQYDRSMCAVWCNVNEHNIYVKYPTVVRLPSNVISFELKVQQCPETPSADRVNTACPLRYFNRCLSWSCRFFECSTLEDRGTEPSLLLRNAPAVSLRHKQLWSHLLLLNGLLP